jgi:hypothetical protein
MRDGSGDAVAVMYGARGGAGVAPGGVRTRQFRPLAYLAWAGAAVPPVRKPHPAPVLNRRFDPPPLPIRQRSARDAVPSGAC